MMIQSVTYDHKQRAIPGHLPFVMSPDLILDEDHMPPEILGGDFQLDVVDITTFFEIYFEHC